MPMRMAIGQPSSDFVILTPLDRETVAWWHCNVMDGDEWLPPYCVPPPAAEIVLYFFNEAGGVLVPH